MRAPGLGRIALATVLIGAVMMTAAPAATAESGPPGELWIPETGSDTVAVMDTATDTITRRYPINAAIGPATPLIVTASPDGSKVYVVNYTALATPSIGIIDRRNGTTRIMPVDFFPSSALVSADGKELYIGQKCLPFCFGARGFDVLVLDIATDTIVRRLTPEGPAINANLGPDGLLYNGFLDGISAMDPVTGAVVKPKLKLNDKDAASVATHDGSFAAFTHDGTKMYVFSQTEIHVIDVERWTVTKSFKNGPFTGVISPDGSKLYVTQIGNGTTGVMVFDTGDEHLLGTIPAEGQVIGMTFSGDGSRGYISDSGPTTRSNLGGSYGLDLFFAGIDVRPPAYGPGRIITFDPATDQVLSSAPTAVAPAIPIWLPNL
ncbi:YncE family protein [Nocardia sp. NPDC051570]|uniref:YncE family protein n=1 Tax=Nocardia sp. NPDC051570 TaxID=3364324 RepID=UPI0037B6F5CE